MNPRSLRLLALAMGLLLSVVHWVRAVPTDAESARSTIGPPAPAGSIIEAEVSRFSYAPEAIRVEAGSTVVWTNGDDTPHTITFTDDAGGSTGRLPESGDAVLAAFDQPGTYGYFCSLHNHMAGVVIVT
jgi:plastocyanin